ncbi:MAG: cytochrome c oxidase subunit II [Chroococcidiopsidaceae cyanobacterium CP_BM_ER_R8_30]|nr:cytochrome c oxidase subunit II [Chroococcidiopsidaceae cyanobacterium CP_BM_ER_R8_30]
MLRILEFLVLGVCFAAILAFSFWLGGESYSWMPAQASTDAQRVDNLFSFLVTMSSVIFFGVAGLQIYSLIFYRAREGDYTEGHPSRGNRKIEIFWMGIPVLLVLWIAGYSFSVYVGMDVIGPTTVLGDLPVPLVAEPAEADTVNTGSQSDERVADTVNIGSQDDERVEVISKQWSWTFLYPSKNVTSTELHLPVNRPVRLILKSEDVLHGFYVPEFRTKQDIIPNRPIELRIVPILVGKYQLHDSELSGTYFALMGANVYVESAEDYAKWLEQAAAKTPVIAATNQAALEHAQPPKRLIRSNWYTVLPAEPPIVNHSG